MKNLIIMPGGSSPHFEAASGFYAWLCNNAGSRGYNATVLDYVGNGHYPDYGNGIHVSQICKKLLSCRRDIFECKFTMFCRCLGCHVGPRLFQMCPEIAENCEKLIFWSLPPNWYIWKSLN